MERKKETKDAGRDHGELPYFLFDFMEILYILAAEHEAEDSSVGLALFLDTYIWPLNDKVTPWPWLELSRIKNINHIKKFLKILKFEKTVQGLFENRAERRQTETESPSKLIDFDDVLEIAWQVQLFPFKVSKKDLRFNYLYCRSN
jgi:hypothetical protein